MNIAKKMLMCALSIVLPLTAVASDGGKITMDVTPVITDNGKNALLRFRVRYDGSRELLAKSSSIPGNGREPIAVSADQYPLYDAKDFVACPAPVQVYFFNHSAPGEIAIKSGQEFVQEVDLNETFRNLSEIISKCDLVIHWSYRPVFKGRVSLERMAGAVVIPASMRIGAVPAVVMPLTVSSTD